MSDLLEWLATQHHEQWARWSKDIVHDEPISEERLARWEKLWCPYNELSEADKELDRKWARH
jgi:hypothetical protein